MRRLAVVEGLPAVFDIVPHESWRGAGAASVVRDVTALICASFTGRAKIGILATGVDVNENANSSNGQGFRARAVG